MILYSIPNLSLNNSKNYNSNNSYSSNNSSLSTNKINPSNYYYDDDLNDDNNIKLIQQRYKLHNKIEKQLRKLLIKENNNETKLSFFSSLNNSKTNINNSNNSKNNDNNQFFNINHFNQKLSIIFWNKSKDTLFLKSFFKLISANQETSKHLFKIFIEILKSSVILENNNKLIFEEYSSNSSSSNNVSNSASKEKSKINKVPINKELFKNYMDNVDISNWFIEFFSGDKNRILSWFDNFEFSKVYVPSSSNNVSDGNNNKSDVTKKETPNYENIDKYGSLALERFILTKRDEYWDLLEWNSGIDYSPCVVVQKKELLKQLNVIKTIHSIIDKKAPFFNSSYFNESVQNHPNEFFQLDQDYIIDRLIKFISSIINNNNEINHIHMTHLINCIDNLIEIIPTFINPIDIIITLNNSLKYPDEDVLLLSSKLLIENYIPKQFQQQQQSNLSDMNKINLLNDVTLFNCNWKSVKISMIFNSLSPNNINKLMNQITKNIEFKTILDKRLKKYIPLVYNSDLETSNRAYTLLAQDILIETENDDKTELIKFILIESFIYYYILKNQFSKLLNESNKSISNSTSTSTSTPTSTPTSISTSNSIIELLKNYFMKNQIPITIISKNEDNSETDSTSSPVTSTVTSKKKENRFIDSDDEKYLASSSDNDQIDSDSNSIKKRKKSKSSKKKKNKKKLKFFDDEDSLDECNEFKDLEDEDDNNYTFNKNNNSSNINSNNLNDLVFKYNNLEFNFNNIVQVIYNIKIIQMIENYLK